MDKKTLVKNLLPEDLKGFEDFIEGQPADTNFMTKQPNKKEVSFEHFTFLTNDSERLLRVKDLLTKKIPFSSKFKQGEHLIREQQEEVDTLKRKIFEICDRETSPYRTSLGEVFDSFFGPTK